MSRTLEEAILHAEEVASDYEDMKETYWLDSEKLAKCANEHRQIAEWLRELQERRKQPEIIRCGECRFNVSSHKCLHPESFFLVPDDDFYCGYAERRTDG